MNRHVAPREPVPLTLDADLVAEAKTLDLDVSRIAEDALRRQVKVNNAQLERDGLWCDEYRLF